MFDEKAFGFYKLGGAVGVTSFTVVVTAFTAFIFGSPWWYNILLPVMTGVAMFYGFKRFINWYHDMMVASLLAQIVEKERQYREQKERRAAMKYESLVNGISLKLDSQSCQDPDCPIHGKDGLRDQIVKTLKNMKSKPPVDPDMN